jgi:WD40 repeat protein
LIFDQFEELFTTFPEHWSKREDFFISISEALERDPLLRIVFAMREEYVAELEPFAPMLPLRFQKRFRLERLRKDAARQAIEGPVQNTEWSYAKHASEILVNNLLLQQIKYVDGTRPTRGEFVEPVQLQIVCRTLWEDLPENVKVIDKKVISQFGDVDTALVKYYNNCLAKISAESSIVNEAGLRLWFQQSLITPVNTRATAYVDTGSTKGVSKETLAKLEEQRLIRLELRGGAKWYELTHDRFIDPILKANDEWFDSRPEGGSFIYDLEQRAINWEKGGRKLDANALLPDHTVRKFRSIAKYGDESKKIAPTRLLDEYANASETAAVRRKSKEFRNQVIAYAVLGVVAAALAVYSIISSIRISQAERANRVIQVEKGKLAKENAAVSGREIHGLVLGLEAALLSDPEDAPPELVEGLRAAVAAVDRKSGLRYPISFATRPQRLELSTDGTLALTVNNNELCVWNTVTGQKTFDECILRNVAGEWGKVQFSPDGKVVYALVKPLPLAITPKTSSSRVEQGSQETPVAPLEHSLVLVFNARTGKPLEQLETALKGVASFEISNNSQHVLADLGAPGVQIVHVNDGSIHKPFASKQNLWYQIALSRDGDRLVAVYRGRQVELLATDADRVVGTFDVGAEKSNQLWDVIGFSPDGKNGVLVRPSAVGNQATGFVWENASGKRLISFKTKVADVDHVAFSSDNQLIVISDRTRIEVIDASTGNVVSTSELPKGTLLRAGFRTLLLQTAKATCTISVWDGATQYRLQHNYSCLSNISMAESAPDGNKVIVLDENNTIQIWTLAAPLSTAALDMEQLISEGCKKLLPRGDELTQLDTLCKPLVSSGN